MSEKIEPALSAEEAEAILHDAALTGGYTLDYDVTVRDGERFTRESRHRALDAHGAIAALNATLPDADRRKITREWVSRLRQAAHFLENSNGRLAVNWATEDNPWLKLAAQLRADADGLESYLPADDKAAS